MKAVRAILIFGSTLLPIGAGVSVTLAEECGRLASVQNHVESRSAGAAEWTPSVRNQVLFARDRVRTGAASRAAILYSDQTLHRINEKSEVEVLPPDAGNPGVIKVISGQHYFSSRRPKDYGRIETPTVTAAIRGTEFVVDVDLDAGGTTTITMIEGIVDAFNDFGSLRVHAGEAAFVEPGKAPVKRIVVRPRDAVSWSLYYPRVLGGSDAANLRTLGSAGEDLSRASELLYSGQVAQALTLIDRARQSYPDNAIAMALAAIIDVAADRRDDARTLARRAFETDPESAAAALALSFVHQADFDIAAAREMAETAVRLDPDNAEAQSRVAELRMAEGDIAGARHAAEAAVRRDPNSARAIAVLGFVQLAEMRSAEARETFAKAVSIDPGFPLARLGHGIALFRSDLAAGREEMQTAVLLDPDNSLMRSYLAKAYFEEDLPDAAAKELAAAKRLDPSDPTPYLYDAILKQTYNRPVEALKELQQAIKLNDRRAVYRSRLLLDEDLAVRSADLAGIYNDLGFDQLGMVTARHSADLDQSSYSSHLFLAGTYRNLPGFAPAFLSETLQARIYQPANVNAVRPDVVNESVSFNEYTALFDRPRIRAFAGYDYGATDSDLSEYFSPGDLCLDPTGTVGDCLDILSVNNSRINGGDITLTMNRDHFAAAISYQTTKRDGFRVNNDESTDALRAFLVYAPTQKNQFQINVIDGSRSTGDLPLRGFPALIGLERIHTDLTNIGLGYHRILSPASDLAVSAIYSVIKQDFGIPLFSLTSAGRFEGGQLEVQYVRRMQWINWTAGIGRFDGTQTVSSVPPPGLPVVSLEGDDQFTNAYIYAKLPNLGAFQLTVGLAWEDIVAPLGLLPPRDSNLLIANLQHDASQVSPKLGISVRASPTTVVRASVYSRLAPAIGRLQTLEPTQMVGFNQFFRDPGGTESFNYGLGVDQKITGNFFAGLSVLRRDLTIPEPSCAMPNPFAGCAFQTATVIEERFSDDWLASIYVNGTAGKRVALSLEYSYEERDFDFTQRSNNSLFEDYVETHRLRPQLRFFLPMGLFASIRGSHFDQHVDQFDDLTSPLRSPITADFWIGDLEVGFRLPKRWGSVSLRMLNFSDREFDFYLSSLEEDVVPARTTLLSVNFTSR